MAALLAWTFFVLASSAPAQPPPTPVIVDAVLRRNVQNEVAIVGQVRPRRSSLIASETEGVVIARFKEGGQRVERGDALLRLGNDLLGAALLEARADLELRQFNFDRTTGLFADDVVPEQQMKNAAYELERARSKLKDLKTRIDRLDIRAPYDGHLIETLADLGEWVSRGKEVARIIATDTVRVYANVPERHVSDIKLGAPADLFLDALGTSPLAGRIVAVLAEGYAESHTFPVVVETLNPDGRIRSNMAARAVFHVAGRDSVTLVHKDAVVTSPDGASVFLAVDGAAVARAVKPGLAYNGYVAVEGDLSPGDLAIVRGNERLRDGQPVRVLRQMQ